ncbi:MAG: hypothetical protein ABIJ65_15685, partial [Chloroflexota bacterium]
KPIAVATMMNKAMAEYSRSILPPSRRNLHVPAATSNIRKFKALNFTINYGHLSNLTIVMNFNEEWGIGKFESKEPVRQRL